MSHLHIARHEADGWQVLRLEGDVDAHTFPDFEDELTRLLRRGDVFIKLDLERVNSINSTGLGLLLATFRQARQRGGKIVIARASQKVRDILLLLGCGPLLDDDDEGMAGVGARI